MSGGIEIAIHPLFCTRILNLAENHKEYKDRCDLLIADVQHGAQAWSNRHPTLYFNWTRPITNIKQAEVVITTDWDTFAKRDLSGIAYVAPRGYTKRTKYVHSSDKEHVGFDVGDLWTTKKIKSTARSGSLSHGLFAAVGRYELFVNPFRCYYSTQSHHRVCTAGGILGFGWPNTLIGMSLFATILLLAVASRKNSAWRVMIMAQLSFFILICLGAALQFRSSCTNGAAVLDLRFFKSYLQDQHDVAPGSKADLHKCFNFEQIISHELGHVLGMDHPNSMRGFYSRSNWMNRGGGGMSAHLHTPINAQNPCSGITVVSHNQCESLSRAQCVLYKEFHVSPSFKCESVTSDALMYAYAHSDDDSLRTSVQKDYITEDDLSSLYFLYPSPNRTADWGTAPLPLQSYSLAKLRALAEDFYDHACATLTTKVDMLECLQEKKAELMLEELRTLAGRICKAGRSEECREVAALYKVSQSYIDSIRHGRLTDMGSDVHMGTHEEAEQQWHPSWLTGASESLIAAQVNAELVLHDHPNKYTTSAEVDAVIDFLLLRGHHQTSAGSRDSDGDGLPDSVEAGLEALKELLASIEDGSYNGRWDLDGDGTENALDNEDGRATCREQETC